MDRQAIALKAILNHPDAKLIAKVNHKDNFTHWAGGIVWDAILDTFKLQTDAECQEYNQIVNEGTHTDSRGYSEFRTSKSPLVTSICHTAYEELKASW